MRVSAKNVPKLVEGRCEVKSTALVLSNTMRGCFKRCPKQYEYKYVRHLAPMVAPPALQLGSIVHEALAALYDPKQDLTPEERAEHAMAAFDSAVKKAAVEMSINGGSEERFQKDTAMGKQMLKHYIEEVWPNDDFKVVAVEQRFDVRINNPETGKPSHSRFIGYIDGIVERHGNLYILEHKTAQAISTDHLVLDSQLTDYCWAMRELGTPVVGVYYNILRKVNPYSAQSKPPYHYREPVFRSEAELDERGAELYEEAKAIRQMGHFYRNPTKDCSWDCSYRQMCIAELGGGDGSSLIGSVYKVNERKGRG